MKYLFVSQREKRYGIGLFFFFRFKQGSEMLHCILKQADVSAFVDYIRTQQQLRI